MTDFTAKLKQFSARFNDKLPALFAYPSGSEQQVSRAMFYSLSNGGKRLRPYLVCEVANLFGISEDISFPVAASLEMLHTYSLIHDDLPAMDNDDFRRGKPTCHKQFDEATAIIAGDGLLTYAFEVLSKAPVISPETKLKLISLLAERAGAFNGMIAGQMLDLQTDKSPELSSEEIIKHIEEMKTGCLIAYAVQTGAIIGNASSEEYTALTTYARKIGIAFQISDDILDVIGDSALMGKTLGKDAKQGKLTFVSLYGLDNARQKAEKLITEAKESLQLFGSKAADLKDLADFIISRNV
ncbi:MAG: polyprenyl synthetase family protein [bacterium]|nr:polyprenyl synthetase family protein [bacterium]MDY2830629.1 farnesyl diphosphate synthase [Alphaproteobacteria bacterium]